MVSEVAQAFAAKLSGREYMEEITKEEEAEAKAAGLLVAFGYSDDLLEFRGVLHDETGAWEGAEVLLRFDGERWSIMQLREDVLSQLQATGED